MFTLSKAYAQNDIPFPYDIHIETIQGNCYDDCWAIITLLDADGNEISINPQTHNAADTINYPLFNIQYHYRNQSTGSNTRYDTSNTIQLTSGTYCFGITAYIPVNVGIGYDYVMVDTTICNIPVTSTYDHLEASMLSGIAQYSWNTYPAREFCGIHQDFECGDQGRIQVLLRKGKFPYHIYVLDQNQDTVRQATYWSRQNTGTDSLFADYQDYYTFNNMPAGNYDVIVSDSCGYTIWLYVNVPLNTPYDPNIYFSSSTAYHCADSNVVLFPIYFNWNRQLFDYEFPYLDSMFEIRCINPGGDTTDWYQPTGYEIYNGYVYVNDTIHSISNYSQLLNDTLYCQVHNRCQDTTFTQMYTFYQENLYMTEYSMPYSFNDSSTYDTCIIHKDALQTQAYVFQGESGYEYYYGGGVVPITLYTCPLYFEIWTDDDSTLLYQTEGERFWEMTAQFYMTVDTTINTHIIIHDATGTILYQRYQAFTFTVDEIGNMPYSYTTDGYFYQCCCRYVSVGEQEVDFFQYRNQIEVRLIESPLYNKFNFTYTYDHGTESLVMADTTIQDYYYSLNTNSGWRFTFNHDQLPPGRYVFVCTTACGIDTVVYETSGYHREEVYWEDMPQFNTEQICDRLYVTPYGGQAAWDEYDIDPAIDNNEPLVDHGQTWYVGYNVVNGVAGGWNNQMDDQGRFVFTIPGSYVIESYSYYSCNSLYHYDTISYEPAYISFDMAYAVLCDGASSTGNVLTHAINGTTPYEYYLYNDVDLMGEIIDTSSSGIFYNVPMYEGQQFSILAVDSCRNSFSINVVATSLSQSTLAWELGNNASQGHCEGDSAYICALPFTHNVTYQWTGPNGFSSSSRQNSIPLPYGSQSGWYVVELLNSGCSTSVFDSVYIEVIKAPTINILSDTTICAGMGIDLGFAVTGSGLVNYDITHIGAPEQGIDHYTTLSGDTLWQHYDIWSDNTFWPGNIIDERCAYEHLIDSVNVNIYAATDAIDSSNIITIDGSACFNQGVVLSASTNLTLPYYINWYATPTQDSILQSDTITSAAALAQYTIPNLPCDTTLYVTAATSSQCASTFGAIYHWVNMQDGSTTMLGGESARFFDSGGNLYNYSDNEHYTYTFSCINRDVFTLVFNYLNINIGDTLYIYSGLTPTPDALQLAISNSNNPPTFTINDYNVTFVFSSNWANNNSGWSIDVITDIAMAEVKAHIIPAYHDTVDVTLCQSDNLYQHSGFPGIDISQTGDYHIDTVFTSVIGCDSLIHLHVLVNPVSDTILYDTLMHCQLPYTWNGVTFTDFGVQRCTLSNQYGCDSLITMNLVWAPGLETTLDTTICEQDLPLVWHNVTFTGTDSVTIGLDTLTHLHVLVLNQHLSISPNCTIRTGDSTQLWVSGADSYTWTPANEIYPTTGDTIFAFPERTTTYTVHGYYSTFPSCPTDTFVTITVIPRNAVDDYVFTFINHSVTVEPLENDTLDCSNVIPIITGTPSHGSYVQQGTVITYVPHNGYVGFDTICYTISCNGVISRAWIYILVAPLPDNVDTASCTFIPDGGTWGIRQAASTPTANAVIVSTPMVGDIDGDNQQEIIIPAGTAGTTTSSLHIYDGNGHLKYQFNTATCYIWGSVGIAKVKMTPTQDERIIVMYGLDMHLYAYNYNGTLLWRSDLPFSSHINESVQLPSISFADFNHDGWSEVFIGGEIFDAATGKFLCKANGNKGIANRTWSISDNTYQTIAADFCGNHNLDLAIGNAIYDVDIQSRTSPIYNAVTISKQIPNNAMLMEDGTPIPTTDGNTFMADMNIDGATDIVVMSIDQNSRTLYTYVWDVATESILCSKKITNAQKFGTPQIGDLDGDGYPEICFIVGTYTDHSTGGNDLIYALKYNPSNTNRALDILWTMPHNDNSGATGITMFDFNHDGLTELVYRDVNNLHIINGSLQNHITGQPVTQPYNLADIPCSSATGIEYPVVADLDSDGEAEIIVGGNTYASDFGFVYIFKSATMPWAPARKVWNQYMYHVTNINEDLSTPLMPFCNAASFTDPQGTIWRPFNNFLQQGTSIDQYGRPFFSVPDAYINSIANIQYQSDSVSITFSYGNQGSNELNAPYYVSLYKDQYPGTLLIVDTIENSLPVGNVEHYHITLPKTLICAHPDLLNFTFVVNNAGQGIAQNALLQGECDTTNNIVSVSVIVDVDSTTVFDTIVENQLPYLINGLEFTEAGTQVSTLTNHNGCDSVVTVNLFVLMNVSSTLDSAICENNLPFTWNGHTFTESETATAIIPAQSGADSTITMNVVVNPINLTIFTDTICQRDGYHEHNFNISMEETDTYGVHIFYQQLTNQFNCDSTVELHLLINPYVEPEFTPDPDKALLSEGTVFQFNNSTDQTLLQNFFHQWTWDYGDDNVDSSTANANSQHQYTQWGEFTVTLTLNINQCETSVSHNVIVEADLEFPNVITPNDDGHNDVFIVKNLNIDRPNRLQIFDRWGKKVYEQTNYQTYMKDETVYNAGSGFNAEGLPDGVYYFRFLYEGYVKTIDYHSSLTIIR